MNRKMTHPARGARRFRLTTALATATLALVGPAACAAIVTTTSAVYDSPAQANAVDQTATTPTAGIVALVSLNQFALDVAAASAAGTGGVIHFDDVAGPTASQQDIQARYGPGNTRTLTLTNPNYNGSTTAGAGYQIDMAALDTIGATPISGSIYLRSNGTNVHAFNFSSPLSEVGFTVLGRSAARSVTATVTYDDNSTGSIGAVAIPATGTATDTFFGFAAPTGRTIKSLRVDPGPSDFIVIDDLGFVAVPEPTSLALAGIAGLGLLTRRRRTN